MLMGRPPASVSTGKTVSSSSRYLLTVFLVIIRMCIGIIPGLNPIWFYASEAFLIAALLASVAGVSEEGSVGKSLVGLVLGLSLYLSGTFLLTALSPFILVQYGVQVAIACLVILGSSLALIFIASVGLLASKKLASSPHSVRLKIVWLVVALLVMGIWFYDVNVTLRDFGVFSLGLPSNELFYYMALVLAGCFFIPRKQLVTAFYFVFGLIFSILGFLIIPGAYFFELTLGIHIRVLGMMSLLLFSVPLRAPTLDGRPHPENILYIAFPLWYLSDMVLGEWSVLVFSVSLPSVIMIAASVYISLKNTESRSVASSIAITVSGVAMYHLGAYLYSQYIFYLLGFIPSPVLGGGDFVVAKILEMAGILFVICGVVFLGSNIRQPIVNTLGERSGALVTGVILSAAGAAIGLLGWWYAVLIFFALVILGSMLVTTSMPRIFRYMYLVSFGCAAILAVLASFGDWLWYLPWFASYAYSPQYVTFHIALAVGVFSLVQHEMAGVPVAPRTSGAPAIEMGPSQADDTSLQPATDAGSIGTIESASAVQRSESLTPGTEILSGSEMDEMAQHWLRRAKAFRDEGMIDEAIRCAEKVTEYEPSNNEVLALLGELKRKQQG